MKERSLKILLVEDELEEIAVFEVALAEIEDSLYTKEWMQACHLIPVDRVAEAEELLLREGFDIVLLDTTLPDATGLDPFLRVRNAAPEVPVIALAAKDDEPLAVSLVRQGAQDYLVKQEVDCIPLARAMRCAIERQRVRNAVRARTFVDELTGLYTWSGFHNLGERYLSLARRLRSGARLYLVDLDGLGSMRRHVGDQGADMSIILAADCLRLLFDETDLLAWHDDGRFAVLAIAEASDRRDEVAGRIERTINRACTTHARSVSVRVTTTTIGAEAQEATLVELIDAAEAAVCENGRSSPIHV